MRGAVEPLQSQVLHAAVFSTFTLDGAANQRLVTAARVASLTQTLSTLEDASQHSDNDALVGVALWNMLPYVPEPTDDPTVDRFTDRYAALMRGMLGLDLDQARGIWQQRVDVFPPLRALDLATSSGPFFLPVARGVCEASFEISALRPFGEFRVKPDDWLRSPFWTRSAAAGGGSRTGVPYALSLPVETEEPASIEVTVDVVEDTPLERRVTFEMRKPDARTHVLLCEGEISVAKELGRPGATQIKHARRIKFEPSSIPVEQQRPMLSYWLQADALCLALQ